MRKSLILFALLLVACGGTKNGAASGTVAVNGTQTCSVALLFVGTADDGAQLFNERFTCTDAMSDPRVSGTEVIEIETLSYEYHSALWKATSTISNDDGSWQGGGEGVLRMEGGSPYNYGEMIYIGEGAYTGLIYHYLVAGSNNDLVIAGWIESASPSE